MARTIGLIIKDEKPKTDKPKKVEMPKENAEKSKE